MPPSIMFNQRLRLPQQQAMFSKALSALKVLQQRGVKTWVSFEPLSYDVAVDLATAGVPLDWAVIGAASSGVATASAISSDTSADATGTATWARIADSTGTTVMDVTVGTSGDDINFNTVSFVTGATVSITSLTYTQPKT